MDNINDLNNFLNEKKVVVKRRYTEAYPAKNISTNARVRSVILDAISDGHITKEEMDRILTELQANKRWLKRNTSLFNISEDQDGIVTYSLSPYGQRVKDRTIPKVINEALNVPHKERGHKPVNIFVGRFQPFTLGHVKVFEKMYKQNGLPVVVFLVRGGKADPEKRPFDEQMQQAMFAKMAKQYPFLETAIVVPNGAIDTLYAHARPAYEPMMWGFGTDRKKSYNAMITKDRYREELGVDPDFKGFEIKRTDDNISASKVRNALKIDDEKAFKKMTPKSIHKFYKTLQNILQPIKENKDMKNLKSLNEFNVNEMYAATQLANMLLDDIRDGKRKGIETPTADEIQKLAPRIGKKKIQKRDVQEVIDDWDFMVNQAKGETMRNKMFGVTAKVFELNEDGHTDVPSAKRKLKTAIEDAGQILQALESMDQSGGLPSWWMSKITLASDYLNKSRDYLLYPDMNESPDNVEEGQVLLNEEYIELMRIDDPLDGIKDAWMEWKNGPATERGDIRPAQKELMDYITSWLKKNIK